MSFASFTEFLAMGDHGLYVWLSYGTALIMVAYNVISVRVRQRRALQAVRDSVRRDSARRERGGGEAARRERAGAAPLDTTGESEIS